MNSKQRRHLERKWDAKILKHQVKERFNGSRITPAHELARQFEAEANLKNNYRRSQALRASGQKSEAQRNDASSFRLQRPRNWEDIRENQSIRGTLDETLDAMRYAVLIGASSKELIEKRVVERLQEICANAHVRSQHRRKT